MDNIRAGNIFFDLDGTLINPQRRLHYVFNRLTNSQLGFDEYWRYKEKGLNQERMLDIVGYQMSSFEFKNLWLAEIEKASSLALDELYDDVKDTLLALNNEGYRMIVVTNRLSYEGILSELLDFGISGFFYRIITTFQKCSKEKAIIESRLETSNSVFVGDSKEDMNAARMLGMKGILLRRKRIEQCQDYGQDVCISSLSELRGILH